MNKIYTFGGSAATGDGSMTVTLGGKGAKLAEMTNIGMRVPEGCTIPTDECVTYLNQISDVHKQSQVLDLVNNHVVPFLEDLQDTIGFMPLVSVRSGARVSMAGMMDTVLNVGITTDNLPMWCEILGESAAWDCLRRFKMMFLNVVSHVDMSPFEKAIEHAKEQYGCTSDSELDVFFWKQMSADLDACANHEGVTIPNTLNGQLVACVSAVFDSWNTPRAKEYRKIHNIPEDWGTAVNIQRMVFGNLNMDSGSGVMFSRDPSTGDDTVIIEYLPCAQGEDVVAGIRTPQLYTSDKEYHGEDLETATIHVLFKIAGELEAHFGDVQDIEFTIEDDQVFILQTRDAKRSDKAAVKIAWDMFSEGVWAFNEIPTKITQKNILGCIENYVDGEPDIAWVGIAAGGNIVKGYPVYDVETAKSCAENNVPAILVRDETTPDDIVAINIAEGILTRTGGLTSHAAVVARGMGKTCVVGCSDLDYGTLYGHNGMIAINGKTGEVYLNCDEFEIVSAEPPTELLQLAATLANMHNVLLRGMTVDNTYVVDGLSKEAIDIRREARKVEAESVVVDLDPDDLELQKDMFGVPILCRDYENDQEHLFAAGAHHKNNFYLKAQGIREGVFDDTCWSMYGATVLGGAATLADLIDGKYVILEPSIVKTVFGTEEAMATTLAALQNTGTTTAKPITGVKHPVAFVCELLGADQC